MAFDELGLIALLSGHSTGVWVRLSGHGVPAPDRGAQSIMADSAELEKQAPSDQLSQGGRSSPS